MVVVEALLQYMKVHTAFGSFNSGKFMNQGKIFCNLAQIEVKTYMVK